MESEFIKSERNIKDSEEFQKSEAKSDCTTEANPKCADYP
jgi:hypothetical protein